MLKYALLLTLLAAAALINEFREYDNAAGSFFAGFALLFWAFLIGFCIKNYKALLITQIPEKFLKVMGPVIAVLTCSVGILAASQISLFSNFSRETNFVLSSAVCQVVIFKIVSWRK